MKRVKRNFYLVLLTALTCLFVLVSCKKEPQAPSCLDITCQNGGTCYSGICGCPPGYSGTYCEVYDSCTGVICLNNGVCVNGVCDCPPGFGGVDCMTTIPLGTAIVDSIVVTSYHMTNNGSTWDSLPLPGAAPDIEVTIVTKTRHPYNGTQYNLIEYLGVLADYTHPTISFPVNRSISIWSTQDEWMLSVKDFEYAQGSTPIGDVVFDPDLYRGQSTFTVSSSGPDAMTATLYVQWNY